MKEFVLSEIAEKVAGKVSGETSIRISGVQFIDQAQPGQLTFIGRKKYAEQWAVSKASAAVVSEGIAVEPGEGRAIIFVKDADLAMAQVLELFEPAPPELGPGIHASAQVHPTAEIGEGARIGPGCYVGARTKIGRGVVLYPNVTIMDDCCVGDGTIIWPGTVVRERCEIGMQCILHPNVTVGSDGFGYRPAPDGRGLVKIVHIGSVRIGHCVEIGAGTTIDRGKFGATEIGDMTKIDNLVQIAHNCKIGRCCVIAALCGISGSTTLGDGVMMGGQAGAADHVKIGNGVKLGGRTGVIGDIPNGVTMLGMPARDAKEMMRIWAAEGKLPELVRKMKSASGDR